MKRTNRNTTVVVARLISISFILFAAGGFGQRTFAQGTTVIPPPPRVEREPGSGKGLHQAKQDWDDPGRAFDDETGQNLYWDCVRKTWVDAKSGKALGFRGARAKDGEVVPPPPRVEREPASGKGLHQAKQDWDDPERAFDDETGQNLYWDRNDKTWKDAKTGKSLGFQGARAKKACAASQPKPKPSPAPKSGTIDPCLVGTWRSEGIQKRSDIDAQSGGEGIVLQIKDDGTEAVEYPQAQFLYAKDAAGAFRTEIYVGSATMRITRFSKSRYDVSYDVNTELIKSDMKINVINNSPTGDRNETGFKMWESSLGHRPGAFEGALKYTCTQDSLEFEPYSVNAGNGWFSITYKRVSRLGRLLQQQQPPTTQEKPPEMPVPSVRGNQPPSGPPDQPPSVTPPPPTVQVPPPPGTTPPKTPVPQACCWIDVKTGKQVPSVPLSGVNINERPGAGVAVISDDRKTAFNTRTKQNFAVCGE